MTSWQPILRRSVLDVGAYSPGVSAAEIKARHGIRDVVRLNWNENLYSALPGVLDETAAELAESWAYPEESHEGFRHAVAQWAAPLGPLTVRRVRADVGGTQGALDNRPNGQAA